MGFTRSFSCQCEREFGRSFTVVHSSCCCQSTRKLYSRSVSAISLHQVFIYRWGYYYCCCCCRQGWTTAENVQMCGDALNTNRSWCSSNITNSLNDHRYWQRWWWWLRWPLHNFSAFWVLLTPTAGVDYWAREQRRNCSQQGGTDWLTLPDWNAP